jgi:hypothetical protein
MSDIMTGQAEIVAVPELAAVRMQVPRLRPGPIWRRETGAEFTWNCEDWEHPGPWGVGGIRVRVGGGGGWLLGASVAWQGGDAGRRGVACGAGE